MPSESYQRLVSAIHTPEFLDLIRNETNPAAFTDYDIETGNTLLHWAIINKLAFLTKAVIVGAIVDKMQALLSADELVQTLSHKNIMGHAPLAIAIRLKLSGVSILSFIRRIHRISPVIFAANLDDEVMQLLLLLMIRADIDKQCSQPSWDELDYTKPLMEILNIQNVLLTKVASRFSYFFFEIFQDQSSYTSKELPVKERIAALLISHLSAQAVQDFFAIKENGFAFLEKAIMLQSQFIFSMLIKKLGKDNVAKLLAERPSHLTYSLFEMAVNESKNEEFIYFLISQFEINFIRAIEVNILHISKWYEILTKVSSRLLRKRGKTPEEEALLIECLKRAPFPSECLKRDPSFPGTLLYSELADRSNDPEILSFIIEQNPGFIYSFRSDEVRLKLKKAEIFIYARYLSKLLVDQVPLTKQQKRVLYYLDCMPPATVFTEALLRRDSREEETFLEKALHSELFHQTFGNSRFYLLKVLASGRNQEIIRREIKKALIVEAEKFELDQSSDRQIKSRFLENIKQHISGELARIYPEECQNLADLVYFLNDKDIEWILAELNAYLLALDAEVDSDSDSLSDYIVISKTTFIIRFLFSLLKPSIKANKLTMLQILTACVANLVELLQGEALSIAVHSRDEAIFKLIVNRIKMVALEKMAKKQDAQGWTPLHYAIFFRQTGMATHLIGILTNASLTKIAGLNEADAKNLIILALLSRQIETLDYLLTQLQVTTQCLHALFQQGIYTQNEAGLMLMLEKSIHDPDFFFIPITSDRDHGFTLLHLVLRHGSVEVLDAVIKKIGAEHMVDFLASTLLEDQQKNWLTLLNANLHAETVTAVALQPIKRALLIDAVMVGDKQLTLEQLNLIACLPSLVSDLKKILGFKTPDFLINTLNQGPEVICAYIKLVGLSYLKTLKENISMPEQKRQLSAGIDLALKEPLSHQNELRKTLEKIRKQYEHFSSAANASSSNHTLFARSNVQDKILGNSHGL